MRRRILLSLAAAGLVAELVVLAWRTSSLGGNIVVRCRSGHLFTTLWLPGASVKALRLGWWRAQRCPVGSHWTLVTPADRASLGPEEMRIATSVHDLQVP